MHVEFRIRFHIGTECRERAKRNQVRQSVLVGVELMVSHGCGMETHLVHQRHHRIGRNLEHIVDWVS